MLAFKGGEVALLGGEFVFEGGESSRSEGVREFSAEPPNFFPSLSDSKCIFAHRMKDAMDHTEAPDLAKYVEL